jgi:CheY-like chemotaxis protein
MATILVIDDELVDRTLVVELLRAEGHEVIEAKDGVEGMALMTETVMDLLITDIMMPEKDGLQTIMEIKKISPNLKIIAISGGGFYGNTSSLEMAGIFGANCTLTKPISREKLIDSVNEVLT